MWKSKAVSFYTRYRRWIRAAFMSLLPLLCCFVGCRLQGHSLKEVYLPASEWNDELFYYKQAGAVLKYGYPLGYFGFNESHALKLSFAAWSPFLLIPWILWGIFFGWNFMSPLYCNIALMMLAVFLFVLLTKPDNRQLGILTILFCIITHFTRYMLSGMPEITCVSLLIIFYGLAVSFLNEGEAVWKLASMFVLAVLLTWMRPYLALFLLLPIIFWIRRRKKYISLLGSVAILGGTMGVYGVISHYLSAAYLVPMYDTTWVSFFLKDGFVSGCRHILGVLWYQGREFLVRAVEGFHSGLPEGVYFVSFMAILVLFCWQTFYCIKKKDRNNALLYGHFTVSCVIMMGAVLLMYRLVAAGRHFMTFIAAGIFLVSLMETRFYKKAMFLGVIFVCLFTVQDKYRDDYEIPFWTEEKGQEIAYWEEKLGDQMTLQKEEVPGYENVIIWVLSDEIPGEEGAKMTRWQALYAVPDGFGISCCDQDYVMTNFTELQSRYIATVSGGKIDEMCRDAGFRELGRRAETVIYGRY